MSILTSSGAKVAQKNGNAPLLGAPFSNTLRYYATPPPKRVVRQWRCGAGGAVSGATPSLANNTRENKGMIFTLDKQAA